MQAPTPDESNPRLERTRHALRADGIPTDAPNPMRSGIHSRGYLPHVKREGASYFVTFRLADSLPKGVLLGFEREKAESMRHLAAAQARGEQVSSAESEAAKELRRKIERYLDLGVGACHLRRADIADLVGGALRFFDEQRYVLDDWVIMPNHVHAVVWPMPGFLLGEILKSWKQFTSRRAKEILGLGEEPFWQRESFDHWIRSDEEKSRIRAYIRRNPVTAGLCKTPEEWRWGSAWRG